MRFPLLAAVLTAGLACHAVAHADPVLTGPLAGLTYRFTGTFTSVGEANGAPLFAGLEIGDAFTGELHVGDAISETYYYADLRMEFGDNHFIQSNSLTRDPWLGYSNWAGSTTSTGVDSIDVFTVRFTAEQAPIGFGYTPPKPSFTLVTWGFNRQIVGMGGDIHSVSVPEPSSLVLSTIGLLLVGTWRRRRAHAGTRS